MAATESWWRLGMPEAVLLPWLVASLPPQAARDYPVYLPHGSPKVSKGGGGGAEAVPPVGGAGPCLAPPCTLLQVPHRLLTLTLLRGLELCLLCGPRPPLGQLDPQVRTVELLPPARAFLSATPPAAIPHQPGMESSPPLALTSHCSRLLQLLERWWQPLLEPLRACLPLGPRALPEGFPLHSDILG